jgi:hypothetical protein
MKLLSILLASTLATAAWADGITITSNSHGIVIDEGATGQYALIGPKLSFPKDGDPKKMLSIDPVFVPAADGLGGTINYPGSPGDAKLKYAISAADNTVTFSFDQAPATPVNFDLEADFMTSQFFGGLYEMGDKPVVNLPIGLLMWTTRSGFLPPCPLQRMKHTSASSTSLRFRATATNSTAFFSIRCIFSNRLI